MELFNKFFGNKKKDIEKKDEESNNAFDESVVDKNRKLLIDEGAADDFDKALASALSGLFGNSNNRDTRGFVPKGKFGYEPTNPIMTAGIAQGYMYLNQLMCENGDDIKYNRIGSFSSGLNELPNPVDGYTIINSRTSEKIGTLYIYAYSHGNSVQLPEGFRFK